MQPSAIFRIGYAPDPWLLSPTPSFQGRFDDPDKSYRVLYGATQRIGPFMECLAGFRGGTLPELRTIAHAAPDTFPTGEVPRDWLTKNRLGRARFSSPPKCADIGSAEWIAELNRSLAHELASYGFSAFDSSVLYQAKYRALTQLIGKEIRRRGYAGIVYRSRWGHDIENWAIFDPWGLEKDDPVLIADDDPDLVCAMRHHNLQLDR